MHLAMRSESFPAKGLQGYSGVSSLSSHPSGLVAAHRDPPLGSRGGEIGWKPDGTLLRQGVPVRVPISCSSPLSIPLVSRTDR